MEKIRSFIAIDIDDSTLINKIVALQDSLKGLGASIKFVEPQNIHLTLRFLGEITPFQVEQVKKILDTITFKPFTIRLEKLGTFPSISRPRVLWIGVSQGGEIVCRIQREIESQLRKLGFRKEKEEFIPHITIGRVRGGNLERLRKRILELQDTLIGDFEVKFIRLKKSTLTPRGPIYTTLYEKRAIE